MWRLSAGRRAASSDGLFTALAGHRQRCFTSRRPTSHLRNGTQKEDLRFTAADSLFQRDTDMTLIGPAFSACRRTALGNDSGRPRLDRSN
jgi:hypothetical protein